MKENHITEPHPFAVRHRSSANGMQAGDRVRSKIDGRTGVADEFLHDGDTFMSWDDGTHGTYKWHNLELVAESES